MKDFNFFIPLKKGTSLGEHTQITEVLPNGETRTRYKIPGTASTNSLDRDDEIVSSDCLKDMVRQILAKKMPIFGNHQHDWENMLGYSNEAEATKKSMDISILTEYEETNPKITSLIGKLDAKMPIGLSIGGKVLKSHEEFKKELNKKITVLDQVNLLETSVVGIGSNPDAFLSIPQQISKSLKRTVNLEEKGMDENELNETLAQANCPKCGKPADLRQFLDGKADYFCEIDGTRFSVESPAKVTAIPASQPVQQPIETVDHQEQEPLGAVKKSNAGGSNLKNKLSKSEAEEEEKKKAEDDEEDTNKENEEEDKKKAKKEDDEEDTEKEDGEDEEEEKAYKSFMKHMSRYKTETAKQEGIDAAPGAEADEAGNTIGGHGGAGKSLKEFETMKKAIKEGISVEGMNPAIKKKFSDGLDVKSFKADFQKVK